MSDTDKPGDVNTGSTFARGISDELGSVRVGPATPITRTVIEQAGPGRADLIDGDRLVWEAEAFPSFARSDDYRLARQIMGTPEREPWARNGSTPDAVLAEVRCGHSNGKGGRCGLRLTPIQVKGKIFYLSTRCTEREPRHRSQTTGIIEDVVIRMATDEYQSATMESAIRSVRTRTASMQLKVETLQRELASATDRCNAASDKVLAAEHAEDAAEANHWKEQVVRYRQQRAIARQAIDEAQLILMDAQTPRQLEQRLAIVNSIATRLPELLQHATGNKARLRELLGVLVRDVSVLHVAQHILLVEATFPNGSSTRQLVLTRRLVSSQPERAAALAGVKNGRAPEILARELTAGQNRGSESKIISEKSVFTLALLGQYFESIQPRTTSGETLGAIAERVRSDLDTVRRSVFSGVLGPACVQPDGALLISPTERELESGFPEYARRRSEERAGWQSGDAVSRPVLEKYFGIPAGATEYRQRADPSLRTVDLTGRSYYRLSGFGFPLDSERPDIARDMGRSTYASTDIAAAVLAAGYSEAETGNFYPKADLIGILRRKGCRAGYSAVRDARISGTLLSIPCRIGSIIGRGGRRLSYLVWCPKSVTDDPIEENVRGWLRGKCSPSTPARR